MGELRKITVQVPADDLAMAQAYTGEGVTETVRAALKRLASIEASTTMSRSLPATRLPPLRRALRAAACVTRA